MHILNRKLTERIQIADKVVVTVLEIHRNMVRVGIDAPRDIRVLRAELPVHSPAQGGDYPRFESTVIQRTM